MSKGYVYVLSNEFMPGLLKIGMTTRSPEDRAKQIGDATGVPVPFKVEHSVLCPDCVSAEASVHDLLDEHRINPNREFFSCDVGAAIRSVNDVHREQVEEWLEEFLPGHVMVEEPDYIDPSTLSIIGLVTGMNGYEIPPILGEIRCDDDGLDFQELANRWEARKRRNRERIQSRNETSDGAAVH